MKNRITKSQFTEAVYSNYHGETLTSIAKDFGIGQSTLSQLKTRRQDEWIRIEQQITATQIVQLVFNTHLTPQSNPNK